MDTDKQGRLLAYGAGLALFAWFVFAIRGGLDSQLSGDDVMNLHYYWSRPWSALLKANMFFWSSFFRPAGGLFYRCVYALWGLDPLPFRIVELVLLCVNFGLLAAVVHQLTGSRWCALVALLAIGIHPTFSTIYVDNGSIFDILAYTCCWGAFAWYVHLRQKGRLPGVPGMALLLCLFAAALDSKEISVALPAAVALYELVWNPPTDWKPTALWRWICHEGRYAAIGAVFAVAYTIGKRYGPQSMFDVAGYRPHYSVAAYFQSQAHFLQELVYRPVTISAWQSAALLAVMAVLAALSRRRCLVWGLGFILAGVLPLAFIPERGGYAYYVPSVGCAVYGTGLLDWLLEVLTGRRIRLRRAAQAVLLALLFVVLAPWQRKWIEMHAHASHDMQGRFQERFQRYQDQIRALIPAPRKGARILLLSDADERDDFGIYMLLRLTYNDPSLEAYRMKVLNEYHAQVDRSSYDYVLDWVDGRFVLVGRK
jgi:hypothetical protein